MAVGLEKMVAAARRDHPDQLCRHAVRRRARLCPQFPRGRKHLARPLDPLHRQAADGVLPHGARHRVRADLRHRLRPRSDGRRSRAHRPFDRRARQAIRRNGREYRHEAGRGPALHRRKLDRGDALCRAAAGRGGIRQLHAAALRDQCAQRLGDGLCRRRRHRRRVDHRDPEVLLLRRQRYPADADPHRVRDRHRHRLVPRTPVRQGAARMTKRSLLETDGLRAKYPDVFERLAWPAMLLVTTAIFVLGLVHLGFSPLRMLNGLHELGWISLMMLPPNPGSSLPLYLHALGETLSIALLGTTLAAVFAFPVSLLAAKNIVPSNFFRFPIRRFLDTIRGVDTLIWALVWINVVGLGPFAGVLAIAVSDFGALGKLFSEAIEGADKKQVEGIRASGGNALHAIRFGLMPQVFPVIAGQMLYFFESNTRSATIIGIVGAGGIGLQLSEQIRVLEWQKVSFLILMILIAVAAIDWISSRLRFAIIGPRAVA